MTWRRALGLLLSAAGCIGFVTVADDLDHVGELFAVGGILLAGVALLLEGARLSIVRHLSLSWVAVGIGVGEVAGLAAGHVPAGVGAGIILGAMASRMIGLKRP